jgi:Nuclear transport factor 2 (NTF2) domain
MAHHWAIIYNSSTKISFYKIRKVDAIMTYIELSATGEEVTREAANFTDRLSEPAICRYFETFNAQDFQTTASLFAPDGALCPPFETAVVGSAAIAGYLEKEAKGMKALPHQETAQPLENGNVECRVTGKVLTSLFSVNVAWKFVIDPQSKILTVQVKLLAALEELLKLKR